MDCKEVKRGPGAVEHRREHQHRRQSAQLSAAVKSDIIQAGAGTSEAATRLDAVKGRGVS
jgi:hypothetical protein